MTNQYGIDQALASLLLLVSGRARWSACSLGGAAATLLLRRGDI